jgi:hypothetical protein
MCDEQPGRPQGTHTLRLTSLEFLCLQRCWGLLWCVCGGIRWSPGVFITHAHPTKMKCQRSVNGVAVDTSMVLVRFVCGWCDVRCDVRCGSVVCSHGVHQPCMSVGWLVACSQCRQPEQLVRRFSVQLLHHNSTMSRIDAAIHEFAQFFANVMIARTSGIHICFIRLIATHIHALVLCRRCRVCRTLRVSSVVVLLIVGRVQSLAGASIDA